MTLIVCAECGHSISDAAAACVSCGCPIALARKRPEPTPSSPRRQAKIFAAVCVAFLMFALAVNIGERGDGGNSADRAPAATTSYGDRGILVGAAMACRTRDGLDRLVELSADPPSFALYVINPINGCAAMDTGTAVIVDEVGFGVRRFHVVGDPRVLWTQTESIRPAVPK